MIYREDRYIDFLKSKGTREGTLVYIMIYLRQFNEWLIAEKGLRSANQATGSMMRDYRNYLMNEYRPRRVKKLSVVSINHQLRVLKKYFQYLVTKQYMLIDPTVDLEIPKSPLQIPKKILTQDEIERLMGLPDGSAVGLRDRAMLELFYASGIRRGELCSLDCYDVDLKGQTVHVRESKTRTARMIPMGRRATKALEEYAQHARPALAARGASVPALFLSQYGKRVAKSSINYIVKVYAKRLGLDRKTSPHALRHSCATHLLQNGAGLIHIQKILGHSRLKTTQLYTRVAHPELKEMINKHHPRGRIKRAVKPLKGRINSV